MKDYLTIDTKLWKTKEMYDCVSAVNVFNYGLSPKISTDANNNLKEEWWLLTKMHWNIYYEYSCSVKITLCFFTNFPELAIHDRWDA